MHCFKITLLCWPFRHAFPRHASKAPAPVSTRHFIIQRMSQHGWWNVPILINIRSITISNPTGNQSGRRRFSLVTSYVKCFWLVENKHERYWCVMYWCNKPILVDIRSHRITYQYVYGQYLISLPPIDNSFVYGATRATSSGKARCVPQLDVKKINNRGIMLCGSGNTGRVSLLLTDNMQSNVRKNKMFDGLK